MVAVPRRPGRNGLSAVSEAKAKVYGHWPLPLFWQRGDFASAIWKISFGICSRLRESEGRLLKKMRIDDTTDSIAVARTPDASHDCEAFQRRGNDASVKASTPPDVRLAPVNRSNDFPCPRVVGEYYKVILLDSRFMKDLRRERRG